MDHSPPERLWVSYATEGGPSFTFVLADRPSDHGFVLRLEATLRDSEPAGLARPAEGALVRRVLAEVGGTPTGWQSALDHAHRLAPHHELEVEVVRDEGGRAWEELAPSEGVRRWLSDFEEVERREARGDNPEAPREVCFTLLLPDPDARKEAARQAQEEGFSLDDLDEGTPELPWGLDVTVRIPLWHMPQAKSLLANIVEPLGGQVGEWGAPQAPGEARDPMLEAALPPEVRAFVDDLAALRPCRLELWSSMRAQARYTSIGSSAYRARPCAWTVTAHWGSTTFPPPGS